MTLEQKEQKCRDIFERGIRGGVKRQTESEDGLPVYWSAFDYDWFFDDLK